MLKTLSTLFLLLLPLAGEELGVSMRLESAMVMERGCKALMAWQSPDGSWHGDLRATAHAATALSMAGQDSAASNGIAYISAGNAHSSVESALCSRALLHAGKTPKPQPEPVSEAGCDALFIMEAGFLAMPGAKPSTAQKTLRDRLLASQNPVIRLAACAMMEDTPFNAPRISTLNDLDYASLYWAARSLLVLPSSFTGNWRNAIVSKLLDGQKADGGWGEGAPPQRTCDTALALQTLILCL